MPCPSGNPLCGTVEEGRIFQERDAPDAQLSPPFVSPGRQLMLWMRGFVAGALCLTGEIYLPGLHSDVCGVLCWVASHCFTAHGGGEGSEEGSPRLCGLDGQIFLWPSAQLCGQARRPHLSCARHWPLATGSVLLPGDSEKVVSCFAPECAGQACRPHGLRFSRGSDMPLMFAAG